MPNAPQSDSIWKDPVTWLYPAIEPYNTGRLQVSPVHELYFEEAGNPSGKPVIFLHGGPGGGSDPKQRRFFHPRKYRIVNFDQRGCGKSWTCPRSDSASRESVQLLGLAKLCLISKINPSKLLATLR